MELILREVGQLSRDLFSLTARLSNSLGPRSTNLELTAVIRELLQSLDRALNRARSFNEDEDDEDLYWEQSLLIRQYADNLTTHRILYRRAVRASKEALESHDAATFMTSLEDLYSAASEARTAVVPKKRAARDSSKTEHASNAVLQASSDVTSELRRTHALMSEELSKSNLSRELLAQSSATLRDLNEEYLSFGTILNGSKRLLKELENADRADQYWIWGSFGFFCLVVAWILYRRILSRPVNALIWTGSFMFSRVNQRRILDAKITPQVSIPPVAEIEPRQKGDLDEVIDMILPDIKDDDDQTSRMEKARIREAPKHETYEYIHNEL